MVQDTEFGVAAFAVQVKFSLFVLVELYAPVYKCLDLLRRFANHLLYCLPVTYPVAGNHGVFDMFVKIVNREVCH